MESEKIKEIKKALYCWQESAMLSTDENYVSHRVTNREILDYINELESENNDYYERATILRRENEQLKTLVSSLENRIVELKDRIAELEKGNAIKTDTIVDLLKKQEFYEKEKLTKFAERIKMEFYYQFDELIPSIMANKIDETLKEFIND